MYKEWIRNQVKTKQNKTRKEKMKIMKRNCKVHGASKKKNWFSLRRYDCDFFFLLPSTTTTTREGRKGRENMVHLHSEVRVKTK